MFSSSVACPNVIYIEKIWNFTELCKTFCIFGSTLHMRENHDQTYENQMCHTRQKAKLRPIVRLLATLECRTYAYENLRFSQRTFNHYLETNNLPSDSFLKSGANEFLKGIV